jgi:hypothetical protein
VAQGVGPEFKPQYHKNKTKQTNKKQGTLVKQKPLQGVGRNWSSESNRLAWQIFVPKTKALGGYKRKEVLVGWKRDKPWFSSAPERKEDESWLSSVVTIGLSCEELKFGFR